MKLQKATMGHNNQLAVPHHVSRFPRRHSTGVLTPREREVASLIADGLKNLSIARRLALSPSTVATYVQRIQSRLGLRHRHEIVAWVHAQRNARHPDILPDPPPRSDFQDFDELDTIVRDIAT